MHGVLPVELKSFRIPAAYNRLSDDHCTLRDIDRFSIPAAYNRLSDDYCTLHDIDRFHVMP